MFQKDPKILNKIVLAAPDVFKSLLAKDHSSINNVLKALGIYPDLAEYPVFIQYLLTCPHYALTLIENPDMVEDLKKMLEKRWS